MRKEVSTDLEELNRRISSAERDQRELRELYLLRAAMQLELLIKERKITGRVTDRISNMHATAQKEGIMSSEEHTEFDKKTLEMAHGEIPTLFDEVIKSFPETLAYLDLDK